jgi:hypothetical protein
MLFQFNPSGLSGGSRACALRTEISGASGRLQKLKRRPGAESGACAYACAAPDRPATERQSTTTTNNVKHGVVSGLGLELGFHRLISLYSEEVDSCGGVLVKVGVE